MGLELVEIVMEAEETFDVSLPDDDMGGIVTPGDLHEAIVAEVRSQEASGAVVWSDEQIWTQLQQIIADNLGLGVDEITREANFVKDLGCG